MDQPEAYLNGRWIPASQAAVPVGDAGFILGATVTEQLRTFGGKLFRLDEHLDRLRQSLQIVGIEPRVTDREFAEIAQELAVRNHSLLEPGDDLGLCIFVTPGMLGAYELEQPGGPVVCMHTYPLPFHLWAEKYSIGQSLVTTEIRQVSPQCWPPTLKCRSRMHYYLADQRAAQIEPGARALLLDERGFVSEASTANVMVYNRDCGLISPPEDQVLHGISLAVIVELAEKLGIPVDHRELLPEAIGSADEVLLASTPLCLLPVTRFEGRRIGEGKPGEIFGRLVSAWNSLAGIDLVEQARRFACRKT